MKLRTGFVSNSSSSSFICETDMSVDQVREKLVVLLNAHNELFGTSLSFYEVFDDPFVADDSYCNSEWADYHRPMREAKGKVIIESVGDNSIPYEMWRYIEELFAADRCHLG